MSEPSHQTRRYKCNVTDCLWASLSQRDLDAHKRSHTGEQPFACSLCSKRFSIKQNMKRHQMTHTDQRPYHCEHEVCRKSFRDPSGLARHNESAHLHKQANKCRWCNRSYVYLGHLARHVRTKHPNHWREEDSRPGSKLPQKLREAELHRRQPPQIDILAEHLLQNDTVSYPVVELLRQMYSSQHFKVGLAKQPLSLLRQMLRVYLPSTSSVHPQPSALEAIRHVVEHTHDRRAELQA